MIIKLKFLLLAVSLMIVPVSLRAQSGTVITADPFPSESPGQYVYYHDMRRGIYGSDEPVDRLIGIMKVDNKQYIIRIFSIKEGKSFLVLGRYILKNGIMEFIPESTQGDTKEGTLILADLLNLLNYLGSEAVKHFAAAGNKKNLIVNSIWESYNRKYVNSYKWWIPFYKLESSLNAVSDKFGEKGYLSLKLICFGSVPQTDPEMFTRINKLPVYYKNKTDNKKYKITQAEKIMVKLNNVSLILDKNWHYGKSDPAAGMTYDSYWIKKFTVRDAQIGVESIDLKNIKIEKNEIENFVSALQFQSCVIADTVDIDLMNKTLSLSIWDADNGTATFTKYISLGMNNDALTIMNFSAFDFVYYSNIDYFTVILNRSFK